MGKERRLHGGSVRWVRRTCLVLGVGLLAGSAGLGVAAARAQADSLVDDSLTSATAEISAVVAEYFERARSIDLLMAQNPVFLDLLRSEDLSSSARAGVNQSLAYVESLYPGRIGEACFIARSGQELARVVGGDVAAPSDLSPSEDESPFFARAIASTPGEVFQSRPYVSPDTKEWVISNATMVSWGSGPSPAFVHFEVTVDSFRAEIERRLPSRDVMIIDGAGRVVSQTGVAQGRGVGLGSAGTALTRSVISSGKRLGTLALDDRRAAFQRITAGPHNQNDWYVVAAADARSQLLQTDAGRAAVAAALSALVLLGSALFAARSHTLHLVHLARTDPLTQLPNREMFRSQLEAALSGSRERLHAVLLLDLDGFKEVNDTLGHGQGDVLLRQVGERLLGSVRVGDLVARLGGDEFAILLPDVHGGLAMVEGVVERVLAEVRKTYLLDGVGIRVDASIGVAMAPWHGTSPEELVQHADVAMYRAKANNLGHTVYTPTEDPHSIRRLTLIAGLLDAIDRDELVVHYQPKVSLLTGAVTGVEALVRWQHPTLGLLPPGDFVPLAEAMGLIRPLTLNVLHQAMAQSRRWLDAGLSLPVSVNCSALDVADGGFVGEIAHVLAVHDVPASMLVAEVTESMIMTDPRQANVVLGHLHEMGVGLSLDDFGTGHSSLSHLKNLPFDEIKIDRSFVGQAHADPRDAVIVASIIDLAHNLGFSVVAEGIELPETSAMLRDF